MTGRTRHRRPTPGRGASRRPRHRSSTRGLPSGGLEAIGDPDGRRARFGRRADPSRRLHPRSLPPCRLHPCRLHPLHRPSPAAGGRPIPDGERRTLPRLRPSCPGPGTRIGGPATHLVMPGHDRDPPATARDRGPIRRARRHRRLAHRSPDRRPAGAPRRRRGARRRPGWRGTAAAPARRRRPGGTAWRGGGTRSGSRSGRRPRGSRGSGMGLPGWSWDAYLRQPERPGRRATVRRQAVEVVNPWPSSPIAIVSRPARPRARARSPRSLPRRSGRAGPV